MTTTLIDLALQLGVVVVVPLALRLERRRPIDRHFLVVTVAGIVAACSFAVDEGPAAAALAAPWLGVTALLAARHLFPFEPRALLRDALSILPAAYLVTGAGWLVISRYGGRPLDFGDTIVELTAVHFHYAGFVAPVLVLRLADWLRPDDRAARLALASVLAATPLTAAGITFEPALGALGAALFVAGLTASSVLTLRSVVPRADGVGKVLLSISALSVIAGVGLALAYALGQWLGTPAPSLLLMVRTHGVLNGAGFALAGAAGWNRVQARGAPEGAPPEERPRSVSTRR